MHADKKSSNGPIAILSPTISIGINGDSLDLPEDFWQIDQAGIMHPCLGTSYELAIDIFFNARHHVVMGGHQGPDHAHSYRLQVRCSSRSLSTEDQVIIGYHTLRERIRQVAGAYNNQYLNELPPFQRLQPTTENLTAVLYQQLDRTLQDLPVDLISVTVWDSPTEAITFGCNSRDLGASG